MRRTFIIFLFLLGVSYRELSSEENFLLISDATNEIVREFGPSIHLRTTPCSSFKIALSLMGYDSNILKDKENPTWAFQKGYVDYLDSWKSAQNPQSWMKNSCVWYSQVLAAELGIEKIQYYLQLLEYGNQDMSGGVTSAWLSSSLKISPKEQVDFIQKIIRSEIPISNDALQMTKSLLFVDELSGGWKLFGKTGLGKDANGEIGWFVGWIEKDGDAFVFAYNIQDLKVDPTRRIPRVKQLLVESNVIKSTETMAQRMQQSSITLPEIKLVGIGVSTSYSQEMDKMKGNIFPCVQRYFHGTLFEKIPNRKKPGTTFCAYTDYESDHKGAYTYFIGEEVESFDAPLPEGFQKLTIPEQHYVKFTTTPAPMPEVLTNAWEEIWKISPRELGGMRRYSTDFEIYDERARDHQNIVLDVCVAIQPYSESEQIR